MITTLNNFIFTKRINTLPAKFIKDININENIDAKDWDRMTKLYQTGKDYAHIANSITNKTKAINRFVAGLKLSNSKLNYNDKYNEYSGEFHEFGNQALKLGATYTEIQTAFDNAIVPSKNADNTNVSYIKAKKLDNKFIGSLSKEILDAGYDIEFLPHNGEAITMGGKEAMRTNGRKWTIGYKTEITVNNKKYQLSFDAITDEGDGPTSYIISSNNLGLSQYHNKLGKIMNKLGKIDFNKTVMNALLKL